MEFEKLEPHRILPPGDFKEYSFANQTWNVIVRPPRALDDVLNPSFWAHVERWLKWGDIIWVKAHDLSYVTPLIVFSPAPHLSVGPLVLRYPDMPVTKPDAQYKIRWNVGAQAWDVVDVAKAKVVPRGGRLASKQEAQAFIDKLNAGGTEEVEAA